MRLTIFILFFAISSICNGQSYFNKKYDLGGSYDESSSIVTTDSGYVVCSNGYHATVGYLGVCLLFLDINGDTLYNKWVVKEYYGYYDGWGGSFRKYSKGGFYLGGGIGDTAGVSYGLLYLFDENGDTLWTKKYGNGVDFYALYHARETSDKGFILAGARGIGSNNQGLLIKTDSLGNVEWERNYGGSGVEYGMVALPLINGGYVLGGHSRTSSCTNGDDDQWLVKTNSSGIQQWSNCYGSFDGDGDALPGYEFSIGDITYVSHWAINSANWFPYLARVDNTGDTVWTRKFRPAGGANFLRSSLVTDSEDILAVGKVSNLGTQGLLIRASANGDSLWYRKYEYYPTFSINDLWDIDTAHGGGYVMCGTTNQSSVQDVWVIKVDAHGCLNDPDCWYSGPYVEEEKWSVGISELEKENYFSVFPNPNNGRFILESKIGNKSDLKIRIYNPLGEILFSSSFMNTKTEIDLTSFSNGIYFITVADDGGVLWKSKVVKE